MKLNRDICNKCAEKDGSLLFPCYVMDEYDLPEGCPYKLEQLVVNENRDKEPPEDYKPGAKVMMSHRKVGMELLMKYARRKNE